jgi:hypothetical protein
MKKTRGKEDTFTQYATCPRCPPHLCFLGDGGRARGTGSYFAHSLIASLPLLSSIGRHFAHALIPPHKQWSMWFNLMQNAESYQGLTCDDPFFFFFFLIYTNIKRVITVVRLHVAQPTYGTCPITCT